MMKKRYYLHWVLAGLYLLCISCDSNTHVSTPESVGLNSDTLNLADMKMQEFIDSGKYAGIYTLIVKDGKKIRETGYGFADITKQKVYDGKTIVRIFSMTKPVTATALMMLYDEGKIRLDDKVADYLPEFRQTMVYNVQTKSLEPQKEEMTIRHLLTHTSGISYGWNPGSYVDSLYRASGVSGWDGTLQEKIKILAALPLNFQPGTQYEYGLSIDVAGHIVEIISGMPLDEFFQTRIFDPLKMEDTGFYVPEEDHDRFVPVYTYDENGSLIEMKGRFSDAFKKPVSLFSGGGGLVSTMDDYYRFCAMLLNGGELDGQRFLKESTVDLIMSDQMPPGATYGEGMGHGLAGVVSLESGTYAWGGMASTNFWIDPTEQMIIITYTQLIPTTSTYAFEFRNLVYRSLIDSE